MVHSRHFGGPRRSQASTACRAPPNQLGGQVRNTLVLITPGARLSDDVLPVNPSQFSQPIVKRSLTWWERRHYFHEGTDPIDLASELRLGGEPHTHVALFFTGGLMVRLHTACEALWKQERQV